MATAQKPRTDDLLAADAVDPTAVAVQQAARAAANNRGMFGAANAQLGAPFQRVAVQQVPLLDQQRALATLNPPPAAAPAALPPATRERVGVVNGGPSVPAVVPPATRERVGVVNGGMARPVTASDAPVPPVTQGLARPAPVSEVPPVTQPLSVTPAPKPAGAPAPRPLNYGAANAELVQGVKNFGQAVLDTGVDVAGGVADIMGNTAAGRMSATAAQQSRDAYAAGDTAGGTGALVRQTAGLFAAPVEAAGRAVGSAATRVGEEIPRILDPMLPDASLSDIGARFWRGVTGAPAPVAAPAASAPPATRASVLDPETPAPAPVPAPAPAPAPARAMPAPASRASAPQPEGSVVTGRVNNVPTFGDAAGLSATELAGRGSYTPEPATGGMPAPGADYWKAQLAALNAREAQAARASEVDVAARRAQDAIKLADKNRADLIGKAESLMQQPGSRHNRALIAQYMAAAGQAGAVGAPQANALYAPGADQLRTGTAERGQDIDRDTRMAGLAVQERGNQMQQGLGMLRLGADLRQQDLSQQYNTARLGVEREGITARSAAGLADNEAAMARVMAQLQGQRESDAAKQGSDLKFTAVGLTGTQFMDNAGRYYVFDPKTGAVKVSDRLVP